MGWPFPEWARGSRNRLFQRLSIWERQGGGRKSANGHPIAHEWRHLRSWGVFRSTCLLLGPVFERSLAFTPCSSIDHTRALVLLHGSPFRLDHFRKKTSSKMPTLPVFTKQYRSPESLILDLACLCPMVDYSFPSNQLRFMIDSLFARFLVLALLHFTACDPILRPKKEKGRPACHSGNHPGSSHLLRSLYGSCQDLEVDGSTLSPQGRGATQGNPGSQARRRMEKGRRGQGDRAGMDRSLPGGKVG